MKNVKLTSVWAILLLVCSTLLVFGCSSKSNDNDKSKTEQKVFDMNIPSETDTKQDDQ